MAFDPVNSRTVLFSGPRNHNPANSGTWSFEYEANTWEPMETPTSSSSDHGNLVYHPATWQFLLVGNALGHNDMEAWVFDYVASDWRLLNSPDGLGYREHFGLAYDPIQGAFILVGGYLDSDNWMVGFKERGGK